ncbi:hypothetical protein V6K52_03285 [Knoellia sp. S7-12]|uniref:hypothetical protein n=1 Tax=Knoellia sp. S7-12 TaxID=3126698 RepID=UPI003365C6F3
MSEQSPDDRLSPKELAISITVVGLFMVGISAAAEGWWSAALLEVGAALLLAAPLVFLARRLERRVKDVERGEQATQTAVAGLAADIESTVPVRSQEDLAARINDQALGVTNRYRELYEALRQLPSHDDIWTALHDATEAEHISANGVRTDLPITDCLLRWEWSDDPRTVTLTAERPDAREVCRLEWRVPETLESVFGRLGEALRAQKLWPGDGAFQPMRALQELASTLETALGAQALGDETLRDVVQVVNGTWAITDRALIPVSRPHYTIALSRLQEMDWVRHISGKPWGHPDDFAYALVLAGHLRDKGRL